jgi:S1-C subfamily serine protease
MTPSAVVHVVVALLAVGWWADVVAAPRADEPTLAEESAFQAAAARVAGAVVRLEPAVAADPTADRVMAGPSTGLVVDPDGSILATGFAVPDGTREVVAVLPGGERRIATPVGRDRVRGVVLLRTLPIPDAPPLEAVPRTDLRPGQWTIAVGRGWAGAEPGVSVGILSATDRCWGVAVQTDASVSPLTYGGPLVDIAGRVIGLIVPLPADTAGMKRGSDLYDSGIGFAIPLVDLLPLVPRLRDGAVLEPGVLGIGYESRDSINGVPAIASVAPRSPAALAGLASGDRIVAVADRRVRRIADVRHATAPLHAGDSVTLEVERPADGGGRRLTVTATLVAAVPPLRRGVAGIVLTSDADRPRIGWVLPAAPAAVAGAEVGDVVTQVAVAGEPPLVAPSVAALAGALAAAEPGAAVRLEVDRGGSRVPLELRLAPPPTDVPAEGPTTASAGGVLDAALDPVKVTRLEMVDAAERPLAVVPRGGDAPLGLLVHVGPPRGAVPDAEADRWKGAVAASGVAVLLPGSTDRTRWSRDDVAAVVEAIQSLHRRRPIDPDRVAVSGSGAGAAFAWLVAERLGNACRGVAVPGAALPAAGPLPPADPGAARWYLLGGGERLPAARVDADRRRLEAAGHVVGVLPVDTDPAPATLCRWASLLGLL